MTHKLNLVGFAAGLAGQFWCGINDLPPGHRAVRRWKKTDCPQCWAAYTGAKAKVTPAKLNRRAQKARKKLIMDN